MTTTTPPERVESDVAYLVPNSSADVLLYFHPTMKEVAQRLGDNVLELQSQQGNVGRLRKQLDVRDDIRWETFKDGFPNLFIENAEIIKSRDVIFLANFFPSQLIFEQLAVLYMLPKYMAKSLTIVLPYFPTATMERVDDEGQIPTAVTLAHMLSAVPPTRGGPPQVVVYDIHTLQERFYFADSVLPRLETAIPLLQQRLRATFGAELETDVVVIFPDDGASKRFAKRLQDFHCLTCSKKRQGDQRVVWLAEDESLEGKHAVIVDDLVQTGGTLKSCARFIHSRNPASVSAYVTHAVFPQASWKGIVECGIFKHFWYTDTCPETAKQLAGVAPFELISFTPHLAGLLYDFDLAVS
ncbi:ribose-phosphate pyrophosphokinase 4 [Salpingoeca rosetta]|uniref:Ribose-phosphate pyrophosphokinase 4 n=1 Tax=Salpingoeca rosetta (strain ATCC 50818 / BSB-021) TaxID=946362 RepID=F2U1K5_SALR5|nr:ribose-phosphate pyrophosphokinase 4 [Salpingoeca rosetta]EGD81507.1 ribose-phosphate pyrophosphokinase 4 [Salpingoeca rosetta]|eukprot:XP_004996711.1 ribose-phosphate pyrophosphokinase 4 [Salpingoeca rosetta]